ncbi:MAG: helix-turn-helix domain-containing protein [Terriglobales bacterium]
MQAQFARRIGVPQSYLSALEHGEKEPGSDCTAGHQQRVREVSRLATGRTPYES